MTLMIAEDKFDLFKAYLGERGYDFEPRPHQVFLAKSKGLVVNLYNNGKIVLAGSNDAERKRVEDFLATLQVEAYQKADRQYAPIAVAGTRIGTDEAGKGDYFGPLVIAGVMADELQVEKLRQLGVKDSKSLSDSTIQNLSIQIKKILGEKQYDIVVISPIKYNLLLSRMKNLNRLMGWGHARVIENLLVHHRECQSAISDQFGDQSFIENALMKLGRQIQLIQTPKAEREITVAAASILAKSESIRRIEAISESYGMVFPRGATEVLPVAETFVARFGSSALINVAKVHFKTTQQISNLSEEERKLLQQGKLPIEGEDEKAASQTDNDAFLECFNLISTLEKRLRKYIKAKLEQYYGPNWWHSGIEADIRTKAELRCKHKKSLGGEGQLMDCLDIDDYQSIITQSKNWDRIFKASFEDKEMVVARFKILKSIRNQVAHTRGAFNGQERLDLIATVRYFIDKISKA